MKNEEKNDIRIIISNKYFTNLQNSVNNVFGITYVISLYIHINIMLKK